MATIDFRGWRIQSDSEGWALGKPKTRLTKAGEREIFLAQPTYYPTLEGTLSGLLQRELRDSDATTVAGIIALMREIQADINNLLAEANP